MKKIKKRDDSLVDIALASGEAAGGFKEETFNFFPTGGYLEGVMEGSKLLGIGEHSE